MSIKDFKTEDLFTIESSSTFNELALEIFRTQSKNCAVYSSYLKALNIQAGDISDVEQIPFLPIEFFKTQKVIFDGKKEEVIFKSSGTTGQTPSQHFVADLDLYHKSLFLGFEKFYGSPTEYCILALLPSYLEREGSSLIMMAEELMKHSGHERNGFYLDDHISLANTLKGLKNDEKKTLLIGVTFGLLDFVEEHKIDFPDLTIMETGGMKGRREELTRKEVHSILKARFNVNDIHSEYGMTELLSQAYSNRNGIFHSPPWMKVSTREINDPFSLSRHGKTGVINVIDLANIYSCSFIATQDLGRTFEDESFEILGRLDASDVRGCNLLVA